MAALVTDRIQRDLYLKSQHQHVVGNIRMVRTRYKTTDVCACVCASPICQRAYTQFLEHHVSVTVARMASTFGVSADFIEG